MASANRTLFLAGLLLAFAGSAAAQDGTASPDGSAPADIAPETAAPETDAADTPPPPTTDPGGELPGQTPEQALQIETFEDWELRCEPAGGECFMYQLLRDSNGNPVSEFTIVDLPDAAEAAAGATAITPLGTLLSEGIVLRVDDGEARQYEFGWCSEMGCFARFGLTDAQIAAMRAGLAARVRILSVVDPERPVVLDMSLAGFTAAHAALQAR